MDPATIAARAFIDDAERVWRAGKSRVLRATAPEADRGALVKVLRRMEWSPGNRRPLFLYDAPFGDPDAWCEGLGASLRRDYEAVREGARAEGVTLAELAAPVPSRRAAEQATTDARAIATRLKGYLDGATVALVPSEVESREAWRAVASAWARGELPPELRVIVWDPPDGPLAEIIPDAAAARFALDRDALLAHLARLDEPSAGPALPPRRPTLTATQRAEYERTLGRKIPSEDAARSLRRHLLEGAQKVSRQDWTGAAADYRAARSLCAADGLDAEEAGVLLALAGVSASVGDREQALEAYGQAARISVAHARWTVATQAWLGAAALFLALGDAARAAETYEAAADTAGRAQSAVLRIDALRLAGTCHAARGDDAGAIRCWGAAVETGTGTTGAERGVSTFTQAAEALAHALTRQGLVAQATHVRALASARAEGER